MSRLAVHDDRIIGVELEDGRVVPREAVFVRPDFVPNSPLLTELGCATHDKGWVVADSTGRTTVTGVYEHHSTADQTPARGVNPNPARPASGQPPPHLQAAQLTGVAAFTNSFVKVLVRSMVLPWTFGLNSPSTDRHVFGPSAGMRPVGLKMPFSLLSAFT